ncbi:uncharacterized protein LOC131008106 [Salvia miltiorrhiza]|uniref:uncharacterized protein LOC131008106 n=1 Tax=Salvia miltiorrhiza TaxID=226208 RepID=UPI0025ACE00E|nr:uncharacterized protein LOC131008106 [Salvia miltiorrhiza]
MKIQLKIADEGYSDLLFVQEVAAQARIGTLLTRKSNLMQQKSRVRWLKDGDRNTSFFHKSYKMRRKNLILSQLKIDGVDTFEQDVISSHIVDFFSKLFYEVTTNTVMVQDIQQIVEAMVSQKQNESLSCIPEEEEIKAAVFDLASDGAAGPDGFSGTFFQNCWDTIKDDIVVAAKTFFIKNYLPQGLNSNTLILIPKKEVVETVADLRPIVLSNFFFKVLSKIIATRLSSVAADNVTHNQFGFIRGRLIHDCIMLGLEGVNCMNRTCKGRNMACKVDIKKAFDTMSWNFIMSAMKAMGYDHTFLGWIATIFSSARLSILYNGKLCRYFPCSRGVRQGDPLSPIIFGIAEDVLSNLFLKAVTAGQIEPMRMSRGQLFPTHLLYADDVLIFCKATMKNARAIRDILHFYGSISGQICSKEKSRIFFAKGVSPCYKRQITRALGFPCGSLPMIYLGVPLFVGRPKASHLAAIKDRIICKFSRWNGLHLSMAGRLCLVKSVVQSSIVHTMMIYKWPRSLIQEIDAACRNFIWSGDIRKRPKHAFSWDRVCGIKEEGGLGVRSFTMMNEAFLMKLAWKVILGSQFGFNIMKSRYLDSLGRPRKMALASSVWGGVKQFIPELIDDSYCLLGNGQTIYFWHDDWLGYTIADKTNIPSFMRHRLQQTVSDYFYDGVWHFAQEFVDEFPDIVYDILILPIGNEEDVRLWKPSIHGEVTSALAFASRCHRFPRVSWGTWIWERFIPARRSITCWRVILNRLPTLDKVIRQGVIIPNYCLFVLEMRKIWTTFFGIALKFDLFGVLCLAGLVWPKAWIVTGFMSCWCLRGRCN